MNPPAPVQNLILTLRQQKVILDTDLAAIYGVETRALNQAVKRNQDRFPDDFLFDLTRDEILSISQSVTSLSKLRFSKQVRAFTEHGAITGIPSAQLPEALISQFAIPNPGRGSAENTKNT